MEYLLSYCKRVDWQCYLSGPIIQRDSDEEEERRKSASGQRQLAELSTSYAQAIGESVRAGTCQYTCLALGASASTEIPGDVVILRGQLLELSTGQPITLSPPSTSRPFGDRTALIRPYISS